MSERQIPTHHRPPPVYPAQPAQEDGARLRGRLKTFFSYAPGTGKTQAMLKDALRRHQAGVDVVVGYVDPQGDLATLRLLENFEVMPRLVITGTGMSYHGMDLDALLARRPQLVLVDRLEHTNPPGLRHEKRYLEVDELLQAGIDVYTTLNVYQLESQVDAVAHLTGVVVRDTVPDRFLDTEGHVELIDVPPQELIERYGAGNISFPPRVELQLARFFEPGRLFALRELALRVVADRSRAMLRTLLQNQRRQTPPVKTIPSERLLICVDALPNGAQVVRAGRRLADETGAAWTVLYVETPELPERRAEQQALVAQHMHLAELLGAETETLSGRSAAEVAAEYARKHNIQQVIVGRGRARWAHMLEGPFPEQLQHQDPTLKILAVGVDGTPTPYRFSRFWGWFSRLDLLGSVGLVLAATLLGLILFPRVISRSANVVMLYLIAVVLSSFWFGVVPSLLTAVLSVLAFDYFFIPPIYQLFHFAPENAITFISLLAVSITISTLVTRERSLSKTTQRRADQVTQLYELSRDLAAAVDMQQILQSILYHVRLTFDRQAAIFLAEEGHLRLSASSLDESLDSSEITAAEWAFQQGRPAGHNTGTFSYAALRYFPLETGRGIIGVLGVQMATSQVDLYPEQLRLLSVYVTKMASAVERALFAEEASQAEILRATEKLQTALLNSISHDLRTPLASITGVLSSLRMGDDWLDPETRQELVETAYGEAERLNRLVANLLDMTRLESGMLRISRQPCDVQDLIGSALNAIGSRLEGHPITVEVPPDFPLVAADYVLIQQVLVNLLENAAKYSPEGGSIGVRACIEEESARLDVLDSGPGIPEEDLERIFEKFYRVKRFENVVGTGLGLSICKGIVEVHGGKIWAENRSDAGVMFAFTLPLKTPHAAEPDSAVHTTVPEEIET